jgi:chromosome segregation ATPase
VKYAPLTIVAIISWSLMATCATNGAVDNTVLEHQQQITELEGRNRQLTERLERYDSAVTDSVRELEFIGQRASRASSSIDEIIRLFEEYQREVEQLIRTIKSDAPAAANTSTVDRPVRSIGAPETN